MDDFSWLAVIIGAVAFFFLGAVWYSFLFRKPWSQDMGFDLDGPPQAPGPGLLLGSFAAALVLSAAIEYVVRDGGQEWGLKVGLAFGLTLGAVMGQNALYDTRPARLWLVNAGYPLVGAVIVGNIAGLV